jgi:hypothetical protein
MPCIGCCTSLLYGMTDMNKNTVKVVLTSALEQQLEVFGSLCVRYLGTLSFHDHSWASAED